ncbi:hypothetical protein HFP57_16855 [Parasphingopyxis algicola]|nr:hypothetical protein [Parasphingopyxis algicola]QLC26538.1 hypothetical protein HFP57_16855 [Parasphingopyxis algicola]
MDDQPIAIEDLPELATEVAVHGSAEQEEVGGAHCIALLLISPPSR